MSRTLTNSALSLAALTVVVASTTSANAGCGGGGHGRSSSRLSIGYHRSAPHMQSHTPRHFQPVHRPAPVIHHQPVYATPAPQTVLVQPAPAPIVQAPVVQQMALAPEASSAEQSALSALAAMAGNQPTASPIPQFAPAALAAQPAHVGTWSSTLPGENRVELRLEANGAFQWIANSRGKQSTFSGSFTVADGRLVLIRANDQQQLAGTWVADASGSFRFKLDGSQDNGLLFVRG